MSLAEIVRQFCPTLLLSCSIVIPQIVVFVVIVLFLVRCLVFRSLPLQVVSSIAADYSILLCV